MFLLHKNTFVHWLLFIENTGSTKALDNITELRYVHTGCICDARACCRYKYMYLFTPTGKLVLSLVSYGKCSYLTVNVHNHHIAQCIHCYTARDRMTSTCNAYSHREVS